LAGRFVHPARVADEVAIGCTQIANELVGLLLHLRSPMPRDIKLADGFAERPIEQPNAALPSLGLRRHALERLAIKTKVRVVERLGQELRMGADKLEGHPILPG